MICSGTCAVDVPQHPSSQCPVVTRSGGIHRLIFKTCDYEFTDITDLTEWQTAQTADDVHATGALKASKPQGSEETKKVSSCSPETVVGMQKQIDFEDYNSDNTNFNDYAFWNTIMTNQTKYHMAYLTCDGLLYAWIESFALVVDDNIEEDSETGNTFFAGNVRYNLKTMIVPQLIAGLDAILD